MDQSGPPQPLLPRPLSTPPPLQRGRQREGTTNVVAAARVGGRVRAARGLAGTRPYGPREWEWARFGTERGRCGEGKGGGVRREGEGEARAPT